MHASRKIHAITAAVLTAGFLVSCSTPVNQQVTAAPAVAPSAFTEPANAATPRRLRLLTEAQYLNTLAYVFGSDVKVKSTFPPPRRRDGLVALGTATAGITAAQVELYQRAANGVAALVMSPERRIFLLSCKPRNERAADHACAKQFLAAKGRLLMRRPMNPVELEAFVSEADTAAVALKDFYAGLSVALEGLLLSPRILLVDERAEADPEAPGQQRLDAFSLATRLSLFLWNAAPDDAILKMAESGEILTSRGHARAVEVMLASPRLEQGVRAFFDDMFGFDDFAVLSKDAKAYPAFTGVTAADAREQTLKTIVDLLISKGGDYRDLFTTRDTFMSPALAAIYGIPAAPGWTPYTFPPDSPRVGILTQVSFLAVHSHPARTSPTLRGKALRELFMCQVVPPPPPNVDFSAVENPSSPFRTGRERISFHLKNPVCAGCHKITDPTGLALENFDGVGYLRTVENGASIDTSGNLEGKQFTDAVGLGQAMHDSPAVTTCLVRRVFSYAVANPVRPEQKDVLAYFNGRFAEVGFQFPGLLRTIASSNAFSKVAQTEPAATKPTPQTLARTEPK